MDVEPCPVVTPLERTLEGYLLLCRCRDGKRRRQNHRPHRQVDSGSLHNESPFRLIDLAAGSNPAHLARIRNRVAKGYSVWRERYKIPAATLVQMPNCPQCGEELGFGDPAGLCPKCLIQGAFDTSLGAQETIGTATAAPGDDDFGRYRVLSPLGEGGMGTVYLAEQLEPIRRRVALKVVKLGMHTAQVLARFNNERQALAVMDHPNIAQ